MRMQLEVRKNGQSLLRSVAEFADADAFARACATIWTALEQRTLGSATSVGDLMERAGDNVALELDGAELCFRRV